MFSFWDKVIYSIFCIPFAMIIGPIICWCASHYVQGMKGVTIYLLSILVTLILTTAISFLFPTFISKVLTSLV
jgi:hypothetical protein